MITQYLRAADAAAWDQALAAAGWDAGPPAGAVVDPIGTIYTAGPPEIVDGVESVSWTATSGWHANVYVPPGTALPAALSALVIAAPTSPERRLWRSS